MNGRVYDPTVGRFLSADPIIQTIALSQAINPFSYVMNMPLTLIDSTGYSWLSKLFSNIGHFLHKYWKPILAIIVAAIAGPYFSHLLTGMITANAGAVVAACYAPTVAMVSGAIAGALAGGIVGGWKGALVGALSGFMFGGIHAWYGHTWTLERAALEGVAGGISSTVFGGSFARGLELGFALSAVQWAGAKMRDEMIAQSKLDTRNDGSGLSEGVDGDNTKLAGGRFGESVSHTFHKLTSWIPRLFQHTVFGGKQSDQGYFADIKYGPGSALDHLLEDYAGPHDWLNSNWYYVNTGDLFRMNSFEHLIFSVQEAVTLVPATAFVGASVAPGLVFVRGKE